MAAKGYVFVITGAAGSGKTTVAKYLQEKYAMHKVITHTTRAPRPGERDGVDYHFETPATMEKLHLLERVEYDQSQYGSSLEGLQEGWQSGHDDVIVLDTKGALTYHQQLGGRAVIIFLTVTHMAALAKRMTLRGDKLTAIRSRVKSKEYRRDLALPADLEGIAHVIVNDQWKKTQAQLDALVNGIVWKLIKTWYNTFSNPGGEGNGGVDWTDTSTFAAAPSTVDKAAEEDDWICCPTSWPLF